MEIYRASQNSLLFFYGLLMLFFPLFAKDDYKIIENQAKLPILNPTLANQQTLKLQLANGLEAYLISDPGAIQSAAALVVQVGSWEDPLKYPGLAHFLEHMLFLGTKKYPIESDYDQYVQKNGGQTNAYTASDHTLYVFSIDHRAFENGLKRFASFFKEPLFRPSGVAREMQAIDQEFAKNMQNDEARILYVQKTLSPLNHPFHRFSSGNSQTLAQVSQKILKNWYTKHYSANLMHLIIYSNLPLETLKKLVVEEFSAIPNYDRSFLRVNEPLIAEENRGQFVYIEPIHNLRILKLVWELPSHIAYQREIDAADLICYIVGDEGPHSLLAQLKRENLAEALTCSAPQFGPHHLLFSLEIDLTVEGLNQMDSVIRYCFENIHFLKKHSIPPYLFSELNKMDTFRYQYQERQPPFTALMEMGEKLLREDLATFPQQTLILQKFDQNTIHAILKQLTPQNLVAFVMAKSIETHVTPEQREVWMHVPYTLKPLTTQQIKNWTEALPSNWYHFPLPNPFIPQHIEISTKTQDADKQPFVPQPEILFKGDEGKIYYAKDRHFRLPQTLWFLQIKTPAVQDGQAKKLVLADLYIKCLTDSLDPYTYQAKMADLNFLVELGYNSLNLTIQGYNDNAETLFDLIVKKLKTCIPTEHTFRLFKESLLRSYHNASQKNPLTQAVEAFQSIIYQNFTTYEEKALALESISYADYLDSLSHFYAETYTQALFYGNVQKSQALRVWDKLQQSLASQPYPVSHHFALKIAELPSTPYFLVKQSPLLGNALILGIEAPTFSYKMKAAQQILAQSMDSAFYAALRTEQQTSYIIEHRGEELEKHLFSLFVLQSNTHNPEDLLTRVELFIENFLNTMPEKYLTEENFDKIRQSLLFSLEHPAQNIYEMGDLLKALIFKYHDIHRLAKRIQAFKDLTYEEFLEMASQIFGHTNKRRLAILIQGSITQKKSLKYQPINTIQQIKQLIEYK